MSHGHQMSGHAVDVDGACINYHTNIHIQENILQAILTNASKAD
jgi:hypothetical protein